MIASNARSGPVPLPLGVRVMLGEMVVLSRGWGSAGSVLRSQGTLGQEELSRCRARGDQGVDVPMLAPARSRCRRWAVRTAGEQFQKGPTFGESIPDAIGSARAKAYWKNPRMAVITQSTWSSVSSGYIGNG